MSGKRNEVLDAALAVVDAKTGDAQLKARSYRFTHLNGAGPNKFTSASPMGQSFTFPAFNKGVFVGVTVRMDEAPAGPGFSELIMRLKDDTLDPANPWFVINELYPFSPGFQTGSPGDEAGKIIVPLGGSIKEPKTPKFEWEANTATLALNTLTAFDATITLFHMELNP